MPLRGDKIFMIFEHNIKAIFTDAIHGRDTTNRLNTLATSISMSYKQSVAMQNYTKLSNYTITMKGHTYQMIDSGIMMDNFKAKVYRTSQDNIKE